MRPGVITGKPLRWAARPARRQLLRWAAFSPSAKQPRRWAIDLNGATCAIQGYGNVGCFAHQLASEVLGMKVVAVSDEFGGIYNADGP